MCFSACHWANISVIVYGVKIADAKEFGFDELSISNEKMKQFGNASMEIIPGFLREKNISLFKSWSMREDKKVY